MITQLNIKNFKSHKSTNLTMSPLSLLTGINSCGKSSVIQTLLLLRQTFKKSRIEKGLDLNTPLVSIGVGQDALYRFAESPYIVFDIEDEKELHHFEFDVTSSALNGSFIPLRDECASNNRGEILSKIALFNNHFQYVSAQRWGARSTFPNETYEATVEQQISLSNGQGELVANYLYEFGGKDTFNYFKNDGSSIALLDQTILWERKISSGITIDVTQTSDKTGFLISYGTKGADGRKNITELRAENIGFGVSYALPVIVALLSAEPGSLIIIENPEAHLHPDGQAALSQLICAVANHGVQVVIETHSDHIINGVLVACKKYEISDMLEGISRKNVSIHFFGQKDSQQASVVETISIETDGRLCYQPQGFFDRVEKDRQFLIFD